MDVINVLSLMLCLVIAVAEIDQDSNYNVIDPDILDKMKEKAKTGYSILKEKATDLTQLAKDMDKSNLLGKGKKAIQRKIEALDKKLKEVQPSEDKLNKVQGKLEKLSEGITAVATGISGMKQAYKSGNWLDFAIAGLDMASSLASLAGPMGAVVGQVLAMFSLILGLFKDAPVEESQEDMMRRVIKTELENYRETDVLARGNGYTRIFTILSKSIQHYRDENKTLSNDIASELFNKAFEGIGFLGELESYIDQTCTMSVTDAEAYYKCRNKGEEKENWYTLRDKLIKKVTPCMKLVNIYAQLSIIRQMMLVNLASLLSTSVDCSICARLQANLLFAVKAEQEIDRSVLAYFAEPMKDARKRFAVNYLFSNTESYPVVIAYLNKLDDTVRGDMYGDGVLVCKEKELLGACLKLSFTDIENVELDKGKNLSLHGFTDYKSFFVPRNYRIYNEPNFDTALTVSGPAAMTIDNSKGTWKNIYMVHDTNDAGQLVFLCAAQSLEPIHECWHVPVGLRTVDLKHLSLSMSIPAGYSVTVHGGESEKWGPFVGPQVIDHLCQTSSKITLNVSKTSQRSTDMIKICGGSSFSGNCMYEYASTALHGRKNCPDWSTWSSLKFQSMEVPTAVRVLLYSGNGGTGQLLGNYTGPIKVKDVDSATSINYMKVVSLVDDSEPDRVPYFCPLSEPKTLKEDQACIDLKKKEKAIRRFAQKRLAI